jgi:ankyrin repeat protein
MQFDMNGDTSLYLTLYRDRNIDRVTIIQVLLNHPLIVVDIRNNHGESPLDIAKDMLVDSFMNELEHSLLIITLLEDFIVERRRMAYRYFI